MGNGVLFFSNEVFDLDFEVIFGIVFIVGLLGRGCNWIGGCIFFGVVYGRGVV